MPTAARLVAAICLMGLGFIVSGQIMPLMPESTDFGYFTYVNMAIGFLCGWIVMGKRAGRGAVAAINNGATGVAALVFWGLFVQATYEMVRLAMRNRYDGPFEAIMAIVEIGIEYGAILIVPNIIITLLVVAVVAGFATDFAKSRWR